MWCLTSKRNNPHLKQVLPSLNNQSGIDLGNTTEYDVKSNQVKKTIVNDTDVQLKLWKIWTSHIRYVERSNMKVTYIFFKWDTITLMVLPQI